MIFLRVDIIFQQATKKAFLIRKAFLFSNITNQYQLTQNTAPPRGVAKACRLAFLSNSWVNILVILYHTV